MTATPGPHAAAHARDAVGAVVAIAARDPLLVALDFDGVCAPLVDDPAESRMLPGTRRALVGLAASGCPVALVSGRGLASLRQVAQPEPGWLLVGGHGAEPGDGDGVVLTAAQQDLLERTTAAVQAVVDRYPGASVEHKPTAVVLHVRRAEDPQAATEQVLAGPAAAPGVHVKRGHDVVEMTVVEADKGSAVLALRRRTGAVSVLYVGDDVTDEDAFAVLEADGGDVGVKVGDGDTAAGHRVGSPQDVTDLLERLLQARARTGTGGSDRA
ncbi:trehalose-phosphatase [Aquipuribacter sp. MA13-6]|uniref:trehalose-phosphatase n=1 Tax=unclassified Aquipuribacter TaxID=2635084 RepID=UPI003EEF090D